MIIISFLHYLSNEHPEIKMMRLLTFNCFNHGHLWIYEFIFKFRTAFFLLTKTSSRKALIENKDALEQFLQEYELMKIGKDFYFQKKDN